MSTVIADPCVLTEEQIAAVRAELPETDDEPLETPWHRAAIALLIEVVVWRLYGRTDYFVGGNMFIYFRRSQARRREYRGPDFFFVKDVDGTRERKFWWVFDEDHRFPDTIIELSSPSTVEEDRTTKKDIYERTFQTPDYFMYDPDTQQLDGWRLVEGRYRPLIPNAQGRLWSEEMQLWLGTWEGSYLGRTTTWLRFYTPDGQLVPTETEARREQAQAAQQQAQAAQQQAQAAQQQAYAEHERAEQERQRAEHLQAELARVQALLAQKSTPPPIV